MNRKENIPGKRETGENSKKGEEQKRIRKCKNGGSIQESQWHILCRYKRKAY